MKYLYQLIAVLTLLFIATTVQADHSVRFFGGLVIHGDDYQIYLGSPIRSYGGIRSHDRRHYSLPYGQYKRYKHGRHDYRHPQSRYKKYRHREYRNKHDHHAIHPRFYRERQQRHQRRHRSGYSRAQDSIRNDYRLYRHRRHYNNW